MGTFIFKTTFVLVASTMAIAGCQGKTAADYKQEEQGEANQKAYADSQAAEQKRIDDRHKFEAEVEEKRALTASKHELAVAAKAEAGCADDRSEREAEMQKRMASVAHVEELRAWELAHCKIADNSKPVVRQLQDNKGEIHTVERRDRGIDRTCDAPKPTEIETVSAVHIHTYQMQASVGIKNDRCKAADQAAGSEVAKTYWAARQ